MPPEIVNLLINSAAIFLACKLIPGAKIKGIIPAILVSLAFGFANSMIKPVFNHFSLSEAWLAYGAVSLIVNFIIIKLVSLAVPGFRIKGCLSPLIFSSVVAAINSWLVSVL